MSKETSKTVMYKGQMVQTYDCTPTWEAAARIYIEALEHGEDSGKIPARAEIIRLAKAYDSLKTKYNTLVDTVNKTSQSWQSDFKVSIEVGTREVHATHNALAKAGFPYTTATVKDAPSMVQFIITTNMKNAGTLYSLISTI